jgi:hypothetical protein
MAIPGLSLFPLYICSYACVWMNVTYLIIKSGGFVKVGNRIIWVYFVFCFYVEMGFWVDYDSARG